ncbi:DUF423 domain-containing protein [Paenibacillus barengoltzii]|jgi:uncharacterized membrane protein YgdD (TMEM256/DUF423 family)|uniref:DUF423 domain-containing protein n=1 Tax=Paenibacillus barengoltzii TaxID=343517 RepID=UPI003F8C667D
MMDTKANGHDQKGAKSIVQRKYAGIGAIVMLLSVAFGAFGAHILKERIGEAAIGTFETGVHYQMIHGIAMLLTALFAAKWGDSKRLLWSGRLFLIGVILFSGSLYGLATLDLRWLGPVTPLGGVSFLAGWLLLALEAWKAAPRAGA